MSSTNGNVIPHEVYPTPPKIVRGLLNQLQLRPIDMFLEPCKGSGNIYNEVDLPESQKYHAEIAEGIEYAWFVWDYGNRLSHIPPISNIVSM
jgi:hypothetical protein